MVSNFFTGSIPSSMGKLQNSQYLSLARNRLSGQIPSSLGNISQLNRLYLRENNLHGSIPSSLGDCRSLQLMDLSFNNLSGTIPKEVIGLSSLSIFLKLGSNSLTGSLPLEVSNLKNIGGLQLSDNKLSGEIPGAMGNCESLEFLELQNNFFQGTIPPALSNLKVFLSCLIATLCWMRKSRKKSSPKSTLEDPHMKISYAELHKATDGFSSGKLIGVGSYGSVYKGILDHNGRVIAVKVINLQQKGASKSFLAECEALRNIRHRNLVKIITSCSSLDYKGNDFKALVFEFVPNGSLEKWLHLKSDGQHQVRNLSLIQRLNIAIDVASALDYLHHDCQTPIAHCDLKPSNVLLDESMSAHVGDFGLARFLSERTTHFSKNETSSVAIKGSIGVWSGRRRVYMWRCVQLWDSFIGDFYGKKADWRHV
ncbi:probable LRR receptor-like serine/threonine-protein kinase At3g47570 isoform X2 [Magnolia sinica]|uniref:probable LRR receptor-like serine/threonine-protein kinase At3g47570 isoform X2 n=1 Tax=Magnolia sinica TaxID=86752 RepID=UPI00265A73FF|nr:probable LRR receptor-like serine/threonine-protein kinase At3g47570 isoform X2 [Magnolia sinica]